MSKFNKLVGSAMKEMNRTMPTKMAMPKQMDKSMPMPKTIKKMPAISQREQMRRTLENNRKKSKYSNGVGVGM